MRTTYENRPNDEQYREGYSYSSNSGEEVDVYIVDT